MIVVLLATVVIGVWLLYTPSGLLGKADAIGYAVCHRIELRSFHLGVRQLPLCARCSGMYLGALTGVAFYLLRHPKAGFYPGRSVRGVLVLFVLIWALDGLNSFLHLFPTAPHVYPPSNTLRVITGALLGVSLATLVYPAFNQYAWKEWKREIILPTFRDLVYLLGLILGIIVAVLSGNPLILYPLALLSVFSVLALLTAVYSTVVLTITRKENRAISWRDLVLPLLLGLTFAVTQIAVIDLVRYWMTGTWEGFHF
ncbi:MAG: DUF2085 domain-containing protein [Anaerolineales bacterium]|nr:DUF2085 domain-containing protein [Anaerolineales bacterium]